MIALGSFALLRPWWLLALPATLIAMRMTQQGLAGLGDWRRAVDPLLLAVMLNRQDGSVEGQESRAIHWAVALLALALAGPAVQRGDANRFRNLDAMLIALDVSNDALHPEILRDGVAAAQLILAQSGARQLGLILYAGDAYLASPLTNDAEALNALLFAIDERTVPDGGVRPDRALTLARRILRETQIVQGDVALISGGGGLDHNATREATRLSADGHALHTLYAGTAGKSEADRIARRASLSALAAAGQGVAADAERPEGVLDTISGRTIGNVGQSFLQTLAWRDYGQFVLIASAAPLLLCFRRRAR